MICPSCGSQNGDAERSCFTCGQIFPAAPTLVKGSVVAGRYEILRSLGRGGMGIVYQVHDRVLDEKVALKVLRSEVAQDPDMARRFRSEIKLARKITHGNVCRIHDYGEDGSIGYIAMELVEGLDLKQHYTQHGPLSTPQALGAAIQIVEGLQAIHDAGVVHRDLKTSNVMLDKNGRVRLMDFGIAKQVDGATQGATALGHILGTPEYMSPEQARGLKLDFRSDIYSMGIVIYEMLSGHVPFRGDTPIATIFLTIERAPDLEGEGAKGIPAQVVPILGKALAKDPAERYASALELAAALKTVRSQLFPGAPLGALHLTPDPGATPGRAASTRLADDALEGTIDTGSGLPTAPRAAPTPQPAPKLEATVSTPTPTAKWREGRAAPPPPPVVVPAAPRLTQKTTPRRTPGPAARSVGPWLLLGALVVIVAFGSVGLLLRGIMSPTPGPVEVSPSPPAPPPDTIVTLPPPRPTPEPTPTPVTPTPEPTVRPIPTPTPTPTLRPTPPPTPTPTPTLRRTLTPTTPAALLGRLQIVVKPWADVRVDGAPVGTTPLEPLNLGAGAHTVQLTHPDYRPIQRKVTIEAGAITRIEIDLKLDGVAKNPSGVKP